MVYDNLVEKVNLQSGKLALAVIAVAVLCVSGTVILSGFFQGFAFLVSAGIFLMLAMVASYVVVDRILRPFIAIEKGIAEFSRNRSFRYNESAADASILEAEQDLNALFDEICDADEASRELIRNISHEVKTPLTSLKIIAEGIKDGMFPADSHHIKLLLDDVDRIDETVGAIKSYSSIGDDLMSNEPIDLMPVLLSSYERAKRIAGDDVRVVIKGETDPEHVALVAADSSAVATILDSISSNAFEHADGMTTLEFSFKTMTVSENGRSPRQMLKISIADDGAGVDSPEKMTRAFWKGDPSRTSKDGEGKPSLGLGLSICDKMMTALGGEMGISSKPGLGTCVSLWFPVAA